jgi:saccharopine dehydrogenase (NAD+, L-lysine-forming)
MARTLKGLLLTMTPGKSILILGGYGNTGKKLARLLLDYTSANVVLAARHAEPLKTAVEELNDPRASWMTVDASQIESLLPAFQGVNLVIAASGTAALIDNVVTAALQAKVDCLDIHYSAAKWRYLESRAEEILASGQCFVSEAGFHPGLPSFLVRYGARHFDELEVANIGAVVKQDWKSLDIGLSTQREFVQEIADYQSSFFRDGNWHKASMLTTRDFQSFDFGEEAGTRLCAPLFFEELRPLPKLYPTLQQTGFYMAGFHWFVDFFVMPFVMLVVKVFPRSGLTPMARFMTWSLGAFSRPPYKVILQLEATGTYQGQRRACRLRLSHGDGYWFTAIPVAACVKQLLEGTIRRPGLHMMGHLVDPEPFLKDMRTMGVSVEEYLE